MRYSIKEWIIYKLNGVVGLQYSLLNTTELSQGGNAGYGGVDLVVPNDLVKLMLSAGLSLAILLLQRSLL